MSKVRKWLEYYQVIIQKASTWQRKVFRYTTRSIARTWQIAQMPNAGSYLGENAEAGSIILPACPCSGIKPKCV